MQFDRCTARWLHAEVWVLSVPLLTPAAIIPSVSCPLGRACSLPGSDCPTVHCSASSRFRSGRPSADCVEIVNNFRRNLQQRRLKILAKMREGRRSRDLYAIRLALQKPRKRNLHGCGLERRCGCVKRRRLQCSETSEREEWNIRYTLGAQVVNESIVVPLGHIVEILHADNLCHRLRFGQLLGRNVAQTDMTDQSLPLEFDEHGQRLFDRFLSRFREATDPKIDDIEMVEAEIPQVVMDSIHQLLVGKSVKPGFVWTSACTHFGDDHEILRVRMERLLDELIGHM